MPITDTSSEDGDSATESEKLSKCTSPVLYIISLSSWSYDLKQLCLKVKYKYTIVGLCATTQCTLVLLSVILLCRLCPGHMTLHVNRSMFENMPK